MARAKLATDRLLECVCVCLCVCMCVYLCMCLCVCVYVCVGEAFFSEESGRPLKHIAKRSCLPLPTLALPTQRVNRRPRVNRRHSEDRRCEWILKGTANPEGKPQAWQEPRRASREPPHGDPSAPARLSCAPDLVPSLGWVTWFMSRKLAANAMKSWRSFRVSGSGSNPSGSGKALQSRPGTS